MQTTRRAVLGASAAALASPRLALGQVQARTLRFVPQANLASVDPIWSTGGGRPQPRADGLRHALRPRRRLPAAAADGGGHEVSADGLRWTVTLRPGLRFHDNEPVRAADCVASIRRWAKRDVLGQRLDALLDEIRALDDSASRCG
jgi:peptide/nickel transport system substrate-binding protein